MKYSIIYSVDVPKKESIRRYLPSQRHLFDLTEGDEQYDYGYLENEWEKGKHRKLCALLNQNQFDKFINDTRLIAESIDTMGSIGAPGFGIGWAPAISFIGYDEYNPVIQNAYVTPIPEIERKNGFTERDWERIKKVILRKYS